ncbi:MAG: hypothetical protein A2Y02_01700 [Omnitrophica bacterium GWA2_52_12]|nr:MAG: hypothetical protein A2Y02_01700 [Omnitrophica bacterium GWA2_52_12]
MLKVKCLFKRAGCAGFVGLLAALSCLGAAPAQSAGTEFKKDEAGLYSDVFNDNIYYEFVDTLNFENLYRKISGKKARAQDVNVYDEVPDSVFFTNRHARKRLSAEELARGYRENDGPDLSEALTVVSGKSEGMHPGFFVKDKRGDLYLIKFDPADNLELTTSAEIIGSRIYHAMGYPATQSDIITVLPSKFVVSPDAKFYDHTGFKRPLTAEKLEELLLFIPYTDEGKLRANAIKILSGDNRGPFGFRGNRANDPEDQIPHEHRRELRAVKILASWLNNYDARRSNTMATIVTKDGQSVFERHQMDFNASLGAGTHEAKPPMFTHEHMLDYGEGTKALLSLGLWEKPWQKRWREAGEQTGSPAVGYFDNREFNPGKFKTQLPARAFKNVTRADAFWAAKNIMAFSDDDVRAIVKAAQYKRAEDADMIAKVLIERRDLIGRYWFEHANALDNFDVKGGKLSFEDLAVTYKFEPAAEASYKVAVARMHGRKRRAVTAFESSAPEISLDSAWFDGAETVELTIRVLRQGWKKPGPYVRVLLDKSAIKEIRHQD